MVRSVGRPAKITDDMQLRLADFVRAGLTIKDACYGVGISPSTFNRFRNKDIDFGKLIVEATRGGWENAEALAKYHYRGYKRKNPVTLPSLPEKPHTAAYNASQGYKKMGDGAKDDEKQRKMLCGLPIFFTRPSIRPTGFYVNGNNGHVERIDKNGVIQSMWLETYERKYLHREPRLYLGEII